MTLSTASPPSPRAEFVLALAEVARLIVGPDAPPWLAEHFEQWAPCLGLDRAVHDHQPTKVEMKERMNAINHAATVLAKSLSETDTSEFIEAAGGVKIENPGCIEQALRLIAEHAAVAVTSLSNAKGKTTAGRGKALPPDAFSSKVYCAILIAETWKYFRGNYPLPQDRDAAAAADAFWRLSGGKATGWGDDKLNGWKPNFKAALALDASQERTEYRRHLALSALHG